MSEDKIYASAAKGATEPITIDGMSQTVAMLEAQHLAHVRALITGIRCIVDETGMMCPPNGYVVVLGKKLAEKLKESKP